MLENLRGVLLIVSLKRQLFTYHTIMFSRTKNNRDLFHLRGKGVRKDSRQNQRTLSFPVARVNLVFTLATHDFFVGAKLETMPEGAFYGQEATMPEGAFYGQEVFARQNTCV
jgi:hypothetical protein